MTSPGLCRTLKTHAECSRPAHTCSKKTKHRPLSCRVQLRAHTGSERDVRMAGIGKLEKQPNTHYPLSHGNPSMWMQKQFSGAAYKHTPGRSPAYSTVRPAVGFCRSTLSTFRRLEACKQACQHPQTEDYLSFRVQHRSAHRHGLLYSPPA